MFSCVRAWVAASAQGVAPGRRHALAVAKLRSCFAIVSGACFGGQRRPRLPRENICAIVAVWTCSRTSRTPHKQGFGNPRERLVPPARPVDVGEGGRAKCRGSRSVRQASLSR